MKAEAPVRAGLAPGYAVDASEALQHLWRRRILFNRRWGKLYGLERLGIMALLIAAVSYGTTSLVSTWDPYGTFEVTILGGLVLLFIIVRIHLASIPALTANHDFHPATFISFRAAPILTSEIFRAMYKHAWFFGVLPFTVLGFFEAMFFASATNTETMEFNLLRCGLIIANLVAIGFILSALAYIGGQIWRNPLGILIATVVPTVLSLFAGMGTSIAGPLGFIAPDTRLPGEWLFLLVIPEMQLASAWWNDSFVIQGAEAETNLLSIWVTLVIINVILWNALQLIVQRRRDHG